MKLDIRTTSRLASLGLSPSDIRTLVLASRGLSRWYEQECGDGNDYCSWAIERDEITEKPYRVVYRHTANTRGYQRTAIRDMEKANIRRISEVCNHRGLSFYIQTDPRGCALYVANADIETLTESNYTNGVAVF